MDITQSIECLEQQGLCVIPQALDPSMLASVRTRLYEQARGESEIAHHAINFAHIDSHNQWVNLLINKGAVFAELVQHPLALALASHMLGSEFLLSCCDAQIKHPGARAMRLHSDQWWMPKPVAVDHPRGATSEARRHRGSALKPEPAADPINPAVVLVVMWVITDYTQSNGATRVVPGSHTTGQEPDPSVPHRIPTEPIIAPAGSLLALDGRTWHGSGDNTSDASRYAITCNYCSPQFRPMENYTRALRPEVRRRASEQLLQLLGYRAWDVYGHTGDPARLALDAEQAIGELSPS